MKSQSKRLFWAFPAALFLLVGVAIGLSLPGCSNTQEAVKLPEEPYERLSEWGFFQGPLAKLKPVERVLPYDLATPLFTDYAKKARFVWMPRNTDGAAYRDTHMLAYPVGTIFIKNFYYNGQAPHNQAQTQRRTQEQTAPGGQHPPVQPTSTSTAGRRIIETRLLVHRPEGWEPVSYIWNAEQTDATRAYAGKTLPVEWTNQQGVHRTINYVVPNVNQCKGCHANLNAQGQQLIRPIGPKVRQLNHTYAYAEGPENQLVKWASLGYLRNLPDQPGNLPRMANWQDPETGDLGQRARAWLDINCAHCHNPRGPAKNSGLDLSWYNPDKTLLGVCKSPIAAGRGSGGLLHDIVPGDPNNSILVYRMESQDPGVMMPELGRTLVHREGVDLVSRWIASMEGGCSQAAATQTTATAAAR